MAEEDGGEGALADALALRDPVADGEPLVLLHPSLSFVRAPPDYVFVLLVVAAACCFGLWKQKGE
jgi:hypothetical protein